MGRLTGRADALAGAIDRSGLAAVLARVPAWRGVLVLTYHRIGSPDGGVCDPALWSASEEQLDAQLRYLARNTEVVSGDDLPAALDAARGRRVALTFDDGYRDNYERAYPLLRAHGLPATFFLATGFLDRPHVAWWDEIAWMARASTRESVDGEDWLAQPLRLGTSDRVAAARVLVERYWALSEARTEEYLDWLADACGTGRAPRDAADETWMTWEMARELRAGGMTLGAHTVDHPVLARCSAERQAREIGGSVARLREQLGEPVSLLAYPVGARGTFDDVSRACAREAGITHAFSFYGGHRRPGGADGLDVPRVWVGPSLSPARFRARVVLPQVFARPAPAIAAPPPEPAPPLEPPDASEPDAGRGWGGVVRRGIVWSVAAFATSKALSFVSVLVLARLLTPDEFGVVAAVAVYIALIELGSDLGMKPAVVYEQESGVSERVQTAFTLNLAAVVVLTALGVAAAPAIASFFGVPGEAYLFRLGALNLLLTGLGNVHDGLLLRDMSFGRRIRPQVARDVVRLVVSVGLAFAGLGALALVIGFLAGTLAWTVMQWTLTPLRPRLSYDGAIARSMLVYGGPAALLAFLSTIASRADVFAIGHLIDSRALGIYTLAYRLPEVLLASVAYTLGVVAFPALARQRARDPDGLRAATLQLVRYQALYALPVAAGMAVLSVPIVELLFGPTWRAAAPVLVPVVLGAVVVTICHPLGDLLKAIGRQRLLVAMNLVQIPAVAVACLIAAPSGLLAVAWGMVAVNVLFTVMLSWAVVRELGVGAGSLLSICAPAALAATGVVAGAGAVRLLWPQLSAPALLLAAGAGALGAVLVLRALAPQTYRDVLRQARGLRRRGAIGVVTP
jgi:O-antigen/teichoic acid export membrane protein/peptidoglycan/xylan/chitin deacetylase (PgdA/CDA1 family)